MVMAEEEKFQDQELGQELDNLEGDEENIETFGEQAQQTNDENNNKPAIDKEEIKSIVKEAIESMFASGNEEPQEQETEIPAVDTGQIPQVVQRAIDEGDPDALADLLQKVIDRNNKLAELALKAIEEQKQTIQQLQLPQSLEQLLPSVEGAQKEDIPSALELIRSGTITDPKTAIEFAVMRRRLTKGSVGKKNEPTKTQKAADALAAAIANTGSENVSGRKTFDLSALLNPSSLKEVLRKELEQSQQ